MAAVLARGIGNVVIERPPRADAASVVMLAPGQVHRIPVIAARKDAVVVITGILCSRRATDDTTAGLLPGQQYDDSERR